MHMCRYPVLHLHHSFPIIFEQRDLPVPPKKASFALRTSSYVHLKLTCSRLFSTRPAICEHERLPRSIHIPLCLPANTLQMRLKTASTTASATALLRALVGLSMAWDYATRDASHQAGGLATWRKSCVRMAYTSPPGRRYILLQPFHRHDFRIAGIQCASPHHQNTAMSRDDSFHQPQDSRSRFASPHISVRGEVVHRRKLARAPS